MKYVAPGTCAYCKQSQRVANPTCPYNITAHAQYVGAAPSRSDADDTGTSVLAGVVAAEVIGAIWDAPAVPDSTPDTGSSFDGFSGGDSGGGGSSDSF